MADNQDIQLTAPRIDALMLPPNFSRAYQMYVIQQGSDMQTIAGRANSAGQDAATAQEQNAQQDKKIASQGETLEKISGDYVSLTASGLQAVKSQFGAASFSINGVQVVGARVTGFTAATGSGFRGAFDANKTFDATTAPAGLTETRQRLKSLEDALRAHGLIS